MSRNGSFLAQRTLWTAIVGLAAAAFWVVAVGVGWRAWLMAPPNLGIVGHVDAVGVQAASWATVAAILTLTTVVMGIGTAITRHLVDAPALRPAVEPRPAVDPTPALEPEAPLPDPLELEPAAADAPDSPRDRDESPDAGG
jgi:hypothetical protein